MTDVQQVQEGDALNIYVSNGTIRAEVKATQERNFKDIGQNMTGNSN